MDGALAWSLAFESPGAWLRAGMDGAAVGLDVGALLARRRATESGSDPAVLETLLIALEAGAIEGMAERAARERQKIEPAGKG